MSITIQKSPLRKRFMALLIDCLLMYILSSVNITLLFLLALDFKAIITSTSLNGSDILLKLLQFLTIALEFGFFVFLLRDVIKGKSIGKDLAGLAVRNATDLNKTPPVFILILRHLFVVLWPIDLIMVFADKQNRRLSDILLHTTVVEIKKER